MAEKQDSVLKMIMRISVSIVSMIAIGYLVTYIAYVANKENPGIEDSIALEEGAEEGAVTYNSNQLQSDKTALKYDSYSMLSSSEYEEEIYEGEDEESAAPDFIENTNSITETYISMMLSPGDLFDDEDGNTLVANNLELIITVDDLYCLQKIVQAEAGNQDLIGRTLVANVIINRVKSPTFPNTVQDVVFSPRQFSPAGYGGTYYNAVPDETTISAVNDALAGVDHSEGAMYFCAESAHRVFDRCHRFLFKCSGHYFYV